MNLQTEAKAAPRGKCFVLSPIGPDDSEIREHADEVFKHIIKPAMELCELEAKRSDHLSEPGKIQKFRFDANDNPNSVANLWADPRIGNYINANIAESEEEPSLTVRFRSEKDSFPPAVSIHPESLIARRVPSDCKKLTFKARTVSKETSKDPATMTMRVVNGHAEHWSYLDQKTGGLKKFRLGPILERFELDLSDPSRWRSFSGAGYRASTGTNADLCVITSVVFQLGCGGNPRELGHGEGVIQIFEIGFE